MIDQYVFLESEYDQSNKPEQQVDRIDPEKGFPGKI
jgi:hypothetical protein